jgi:hypothetical protein
MEHESRVGAKFDKTLTVTEIAKRIRADIKAAIAAGELPAGLVVSVRQRPCTHSSAIDAQIKAVPAGFRVMNPDRVRHDRDTNYALPPRRLEQRHAPEMVAALAVLAKIHGAYNRDDSDSSSDYFDRRYYGSAGVSHELERADRDAILAADTAATESAA